MEGVLKSVSIGNIVFNRVFVNEDKDISFKYCSAFPNGSGDSIFKLDTSEIIFNDIFGKEIGRQTIEGGFDDDFKKALTETRRIILKDVLVMSKKLELDVEKIIAFDLKDEKSPFLFTTKTYLENGGYSSKYNGAILYNINKMREKNGKDTFGSMEDMLHSLGRLFKLKSKDMETKMMDENNSSPYYEVSLSYLADL